MALGNGDIEMDVNATPFEVNEDDDCGRFLVAKRDLPQGDLILSEKPTGSY